MSRLTDFERETIITFSEGSKKAVIFTYNASWIKQLGEVLGLKPIMSNHFGGKEYEIDKSRIKMPTAKKKISAKRRAALTKNLEKAYAARKKGSVASAKTKPLHRKKKRK